MLLEKQNIFCYRQYHCGVQVGCIFLLTAEHATAPDTVKKKINVSVFSKSFIASFTVKILLGDIARRLDEW